MKSILMIVLFSLIVGAASPRSLGVRNDVIDIHFADHAEDQRRDGNWWQDLPETFKVGYVIGAFDGMD
ncbi:MAG: hypothetical protein ACREDR_30640, partial [Blastocatellia bacterium]